MFYSLLFIFISTMPVQVTVTIQRYIPIPRLTAASFEVAKRATTRAKKNPPRLPPFLPQIATDGGWNFVESGK